MKKRLLSRLTLSGVLAAIVCVMTLVSVPLPSGGYANLGDCFVILSGVFLGPIYGLCASSVGSALSDLFLGYAVYAPATLVIKGIMALVVGLLTQRLEGRAILKISVAAVVSEIIMVSGYFLFEVLLYGVPAAATNTIGNGVQGVVGMLSGAVLCSVIHSSGVMSKISIRSKE